MDGITGQCGGLGDRIENNEEIFDRVWKGMGFIENMPLSEVYRLLKNIEVEGSQKRRMTNDPGVAVMAQMTINRVQDMFGEKAQKISILKGDSMMILDWIVSEWGGGDGGYGEMGAYDVAEGDVLESRNRRFSVYDSDDTSDDETGSLMEVDRMGCKRSLSVPSSICDSQIDMAYNPKAKGVSLREILDELEEYHHNVEMKFLALDYRLEGLKGQNAYHLQYLKNVGMINDGLFEKVKHMRHEMSGVQQELAKLTSEDHANPANLIPVSTQIDLVGTTMTPEDTQTYDRLTKSDAYVASSTYISTNNTTTHNTTTILIAFISIIIFMISFFTSK